MKYNPTEKQLVILLSLLLLKKEPPPPGIEPGTIRSEARRSTIFAVLGIKTLKIPSFSNKASIAHLEERLASDLMVPGSIPGGGGSFFHKSKDNKITSCFSVGLYFTSYNPTEK